MANELYPSFLLQPPVGILTEEKVKALLVGQSGRVMFFVPYTILPRLSVDHAFAICARKSMVMDGTRLKIHKSPL